MPIDQYRQRVIFDGSDITRDVESLNGSAVGTVVSDSAFLYIGHPFKFGSRYIKIGTANETPRTFSLDQYDGSQWNSVEDFTDQTDALTQSGFISWVSRNDWAKVELAPLSDRELFWVRISADAALSGGSTIEGIANLFSDDDELRAWYPELVSDSRFFPTGRTDFLEQHRAAKDMVVARLIDRNVIQYEGQVLDVSRYTMAAVHACAYLILAPIATGDAMIELRDEAFRRFQREIARRAEGIDLTQDGQLSDAEQKSSFTSTTVVRR
jgi:hypothetical protein